MIFTEIGLTKNLCGKNKFGYYKCSSFTLIRFCGLYLRICLSKEIYDNLPQGC